MEIMIEEDLINKLEEIANKENMSCDELLDDIIRNKVICYE